MEDVFFDLVCLIHAWCFRSARGRWRALLLGRQRYRRLCRRRKVLREISKHTAAKELFPFYGSVCLNKNINTFKIRTGDFFSQSRLLYQTDQRATCRNTLNSLRKWHDTPGGANGTTHRERERSPRHVQLFKIISLFVKRRKKRTTPKLKALLSLVFCFFFSPEQLLVSIENTNTSEAIGKTAS